MHKLPSLKAIQTFEAAARLSSFALAAEELAVTPSAVSHQVKALEDYLGVQLFHRIHRAIVLTEAGRRYAHEVTCTFGRLAAATQNLIDADKRDILTVHCTPSFATQWLMPRLSAFGALHPSIDLRLNASVRAVDLTQEAVDIDIRYGAPVAAAGILTLPFPEELIVPMCTPALAEGLKPIRNPQDLRHHVLIHSEACLVGWRDWLRRKPGLRLDLDRGPRFDRSFMSISAAVDGLGVCLESLLLARREVDAGKLVLPFGPDGLKIRGHSLAVLKSQAQRPRIKAFQAWLFAELAALEA